MAIIITTDNSDPELPGINASINNGDLDAINDVVKKWGFRDQESAIRFGIAVLLSADKNRIFIDDKSGKKITISPVASLLDLQNTDSVTNDDQAA